MQLHLPNAVIGDFKLVFFRAIRKKEEALSLFQIKFDRNIFLFPEPRKCFFGNLISKV
jgi:hypothetical protein